MDVIVSGEGSPPSVPGPRDRRWAFSGSRDWARAGLAMLATLGSAAVLATLAQEFFYVEAAVVGLAALAIPFNRVDAQVFARAALWGGLAIGGLGWAFGEQVESLGVLLTSGTALLLLGGAGLDSERGAFQPRVLRRTLITMMVIGFSVAHVFMVSAVLTEMVSANVLDPLVYTVPSTLFTRVTMFATPMLLFLGVVGLSRTKTWGLFLYLLSLVGVGVTIALSYSWLDELSRAEGGMAFGWVFLMTLLWGSGATLALGAAIPVLGALAIRQVPSKKPVRRWGRFAHAVLVAAVMAGAIVYNVIM
ncbi:MAG: hypothetical protein AB7S26_27120 [Sandaracinaceae bacterium]